MMTTSLLMGLTWYWSYWCVNEWMHTTLMGIFPYIIQETIWCVLFALLILSGSFYKHRKTPRRSVQWVCIRWVASSNDESLKVTVSKKMVPIRSHTLHLTPYLKCWLKKHFFSWFKKKCIYCDALKKMVLYLAYNP